jgi:hypothetical protein
MAVEKIKKFISENGLAIGLIVAGVMIRLLPLLTGGHLGNNFAPVGAIALFGGVYLGKRYALWLPLIIMMVSDVFLGYHSLILLTWGSFALIAMLGLWLRNHKNIPNIVVGTVTGSLLFFFITNFGVWAFTGMYAKSFAGLVQCYVMAVPFFRNTLASDLFYVAAFFGAYELAMYLAPEFQKKFAKQNI